MQALECTFRYIDLDKFGLDIVFIRNGDMIELHMPQRSQGIFERVEFVAMIGTILLLQFCKGLCSNVKICRGILVADHHHSAKPSFV